MGRGDGGAGGLGRGVVTSCRHAGRGGAHAGIGRRVGRPARRRSHRVQRPRPARTGRHDLALRDVGSRNGTRLNGSGSPASSGCATATRSSSGGRGSCSATVRRRAAVRPTVWLRRRRTSRGWSGARSSSCAGHYSPTTPSSRRRRSARSRSGCTSARTRSRPTSRASTASSGSTTAPDRRVALANEAMLRGAVTLADLEATSRDVGGHG